MESDLVDIMLTSLSTAEILTQQGAYANTEITPAIRLNDTTDIWVGRGASYSSQPALPFRTARLDRVKPVADLGLYAITFYNDLQQDHRTLEAYARFRDEASAQGVRHFLEVFNPQTHVVTPGADFGSYNNDAIVRCLAAVSRHDRPLFLKAAYNGPAATEEIASYDPGNLIFGILGGSAGTTRDCLELIRQAEKYGARVALFGRKIYFAEDSVAMVRAMRRTIEEGLDSMEATKAYHADLEKLGVRPLRELNVDLELTEEVLKAGLG
jgi:DhnA family fructose-bisphosphate aldolase class Ia